MLNLDHTEPCVVDQARLYFKIKQNLTKTGGLALGLLEEAHDREVVSLNTSNIYIMVNTENTRYRGRIVVWLVSSLTGFDLTKQDNMLLFACTETRQIGDQPYNDPLLYDECSH